MSRLWLTLLLLMSAASPAFPDVPGAPVERFETTVAVKDTTLSSLVRLYRAGKWDQLQQETRAILEAVRMDGHEVNVSVHYYSVVLIDAKLDGKAEFLRYLVHEGLDRPFEMRLPGIGRKSHLYEVLLTEKAGEFKSRYSFEKKEDPLLAKIPKVVKEFDNALFKMLAGLEVTAPSVHAVFLRVGIPFDRCSVTLTNAFFSLNGTADGANKVMGSYTIENVPERKLAFGALVGLVLSTDGATRAKVSNGVLSPDPVSGVTTMALLNLHPWGYEEGRPWPYAAEQTRFFIGVVTTPEFGLAGGFGFGLVRGLSVNVGGGVLVVDELKDGETFGDAPMDEDDPFQTAFPAFWFAGFGYDF